MPILCGGPTLPYPWVARPSDGSTRPLGSPAGGQAPFSPSSLPSLIAWWDPSDLSTLWKDVGGTMQASADGDVIKRIDDKGGGAHHLTQATSSKCGVLRISGGLKGIEFDGVDDEYAIASPYVIGAGVTGTSGHAFNPNGGSFVTFDNAQWPAWGYSFYQYTDEMWVNFGEDDVYFDPPASLPHSNELVCVARAENAVYAPVRVNKAGFAQAEIYHASDDPPPMALFGQYYNVVWASCIWRGSVVCGASLSDLEVASLETWLGAKCGLTL